mmetsp:Transcript_80931/g.229129  ORF Transcript_80931/g.229129 Transcript_80931/m.229129 type:complete len:253 (-) Transcript_80931:530-1288(-)
MLRRIWALGWRTRFRRATSTGSFSSWSPLTTSTSMVSTRSSSSPSAQVACTVPLRCASAARMWRSRSTVIWWRSMAMAGPRSREQPRKNMSVLIWPEPSSSSSAWSQWRSLIGISSMRMRSRTDRFFSIAASSSLSSSPPLSMSASRKISRRDSITTASFLCLSAASRSSFAMALESVRSTTTPTMVFRSASTAAHRKAVKTVTSQGLCLTSGQASESDHLSPVSVWKREYMERETLLQYASFDQADRLKSN